METFSEPTDAIVVGGGLAGLVTALELLDHSKSVLLLEKGSLHQIGGLAREAFGGVTMIGTPQQKRMGIPDSPDLAYSDWLNFGGLRPEDEWPKRWARLYCDRSVELIHSYLVGHGVRFLPIVNWPERGLFGPGNSVPRWHIAWGTGTEIVCRIFTALRAHRHAGSLKMRCNHEVTGLVNQSGRIVGVTGRNLRSSEPFEAHADHVVIASGGICGGNLSYLRKHWPENYAPPPPHLLNGSHPFADGLLHQCVESHGGNLTHLRRQWHYAAGVHHPRKRETNGGLSLLPPRSALWLNALGERIGPVPLMGYTDTGYLVESVLRQPGQYSWLLMNRKIALKELAASGGDYMTAFREKKKLKVIKQLLFGNHELVDRLIRECPEDFVVAASLPELVEKMNTRSIDGLAVSFRAVKEAVAAYDAQIDRGPAYFTDDQLRRIVNFRQYRGDRLRICKFQKILDPGALPLIAVRSFILSRKSLGGIQTDLSCRVLSATGSPVPGLYAVGEAAGFGGGGIHGKRSLEGTFLGSCILTGRIAGRAIAGGAKES